MPRLLPILGALLALAACARPEPTSDVTLTILHTNDLHGHVEPWSGWDELAGREIGGLDRLATAVREVSREVGEENVLLLDAGDTIGDTMISAETEGRAVIAAMNAIGYDAMVVGNHEPDFGPEALAQRIREARFPVLAANLVGHEDGRPFTAPCLRRTVNGVRVAILGLAYPNTALTTAAKNVAGLEFRDAIETARAWVPRLRREAELVVVLSHFGLSADRRLAEAVPGIDVIVGGHSHNRMGKAARVGGTLIVQAGAHGSDLGRLDLAIANGRVTGHRRRLILIDNARFRPDPEVAAVVRAAVAPHRAKLEAPLGVAGGPLVRAQTLAGQEPRARDEPSPADMLFADLVRRETGVDLVLLPGVGYGVALPPGPIRAAALRNLIPHEARIVTLTLTGAQIREILEQSLENTYTQDPRVKVGGLVQVSGLAFTYRREGKQGERVQAARVGDAPLDPARRYRVATNSLLAEGGHRYRTFLDAPDRREHGSQYALIESAIRAAGTVVAPAAPRIRASAR